MVVGRLGIHSPWAFVLLAGGFAYFGDDGQLLQVNAIAHAPSPTGLVLVGQELDGTTDGGRAAAAAALLQRQGRFVGIADPSLLVAGFNAFGWVHASEEFEGQKIREEPYPHGAFLYARSGLSAAPACKAVNDADALQPLVVAEVIELEETDVLNAVGTEEHPLTRLYLYALEPGSFEQAKRAQAAAKEAASAQLDFAPRASKACTMGLSTAMSNVRAKSIVAQHVVMEAARVSSLEARGSHAVSMKYWLRNHAMRLIAISLYVILGVLVYRACEDSWSTTEALYFSVVTIASVVLTCLYYSLCYQYLLPI